MPLSDNTSVLDVIEADVVGSQRHPRTVGFIHGVCNSSGLTRIELRTAEDTVFRVHPVVQPKVICGRLRQHHDAAYAGGRNGLGAPVRFLVADRSK